MCPPESPAYVPSPKSLKLLRSKSFLPNICKEIEAGASPHVAAQVQGMKEDDYWHFWYEGKAASRKKEQDQTDLDEILAKLVDEVTLFLAKARMKAEQSVFSKHPHLYLTRGPGRPGGGECRHWAQSPQEELERQKKNFESHPLRYLSSGAAGGNSYYAQKAAMEKRVGEMPFPCAQCEAALMDEL
ncbi:MAG: hypothetical protein AB1405_17335, partial [Bdellovibrionota bacterium]